MTANENFKKALKEGNLADALVIALSKATELKITTSIVSANDYYGQNPPLRPEDCLETKINLLKGEIENKIGENLLKSELYNKLQEVHLKETMEGNQIIEQNLETLQKLFTILAEIKQQQLELKNPEIVSYHLGNQLPPPPPPAINYPTPLKKENIANQQSTIIDTKNTLETHKKEARKPKKRTQRYDWQTLTESLGAVEIVPEDNQEIPIENMENKDLMEDWGDLIIEENTVSNESLIDTISPKEKSINTDTTIISSKEVEQLITDDNIAEITVDNSEDKLEDEEIIEQFSVEEDQLNFDTKVMSETELKSFVAEEKKRKSTLENKENFSTKKIQNNPISEHEINDLLDQEDWGNLIEDSEEIETNTNDWDQVMGNLYEQKSSQKPTDKK